MVSDCEIKFFSTTSPAARKLHLDLTGITRTDQQQEQEHMHSPNARTVEESKADGDDTYGQVNQHPRGAGAAFEVGVSVDRNKKCRRTMEESVSSIKPGFDQVRG